jgi:integrase
VRPGQPPRVPTREMVFLPWEEAVELAEGHGERHRALVYLTVESGMRWSELVGLRRARVDLLARKVRVTEQLVRLERGEWHRKEPKTPSSVRSITISPVTVGLMAEHLERFTSPGRDGLVFPGRTGRPLASSRFWSNHFTPALRRSGLSCQFHDLRHTSVALAIVEGAHPKAIQTRMDGSGRMWPSDT